MSEGNRVHFDLNSLPTVESPSTPTPPSPVQNNFSSVPVSRGTTATTFATAGSSSNPAPPSLVLPLVRGADQRTTTSSSRYRAVSPCRGKKARYEAYVWFPVVDCCERKKCKERKGTYDKETEAAKAYDIASLKIYGPKATLNFNEKSCYDTAISQNEHTSWKEVVTSLRSNGKKMTSGASIYRGVHWKHEIIVGMRQLVIQRDISGFLRSKKKRRMPTTVKH